MAKMGEASHGRVRAERLMPAGKTDTPGHCVGRFLGVRSGLIARAGERQPGVGLRAVAMHQQPETTKGVVFVTLGGARPGL